MTLQEIQYKAQSIISKWRDDDSAPYIEFVEELAHMIVPEPSEDLVEVAIEYSKKVSDGHNYRDLRVGFIAGAEWQADHTPLPEDTVLFNKGVAEGKRLAEEEQADLFTIVALDAAQRAKEQMMKEAVDAKFISMDEGIIKYSPLFTRKLKQTFRPSDKVRIIIVKEGEK